MDRRKKKSYVFSLQYVSQAKPVREREREREKKKKKKMGKFFILHILSIYQQQQTIY